MQKNSYYLCIVCIVFLFFALLCQFYRADRAVEKSTGDNGAVAEINRATELIEQAGAENKSAQQAIARAEERVDNAQAGIDDCETILAELRADNQRAKQIVDEIIRGASQRAEEN